MEEDSFPGQFKRLEDKTEELIQTCRDLQETKSELEAKIYDLEGALRTKVAAEQEHVEERSMVRSKIEGLLSRLDQALGSE
ncbi:MAG: cell division protein ZapB [Desulfobacterales bacterium]|nr:cell division protein ZapB [Desulfobacterales bacterium]